MKICTSCSITFTDDYLSFCTSCGALLETAKQSGSYNENIESNDPAPPTPFSEPYSFNDPSSSSSSSMETLIAPKSLFSDPSPSYDEPSHYNEPSTYNEPSQSKKSYSEEPTLNRPFAEPPKQSSQSQQDPYQPLFGSQPPAQYSSQGKQSHPEWQPPPPPVQGWGNNAVGANYAYTQTPQQGLAMASMITGIVSCTIGMCCYIGTATGPVAIILGIIALVQIKNDPKRHTGKGMAIAGIITGALYFVFIALFLVLYGALSVFSVLVG